MEETVFRYTPSALLEKARWEQRALAVECAHLRLQWEGTCAQHDTTRARIAQIEDALRQMYTHAQGWSAQDHVQLHVFLAHQHEMARVQARTREQARLAHENAMAQLQTKQVSVRMLERHRERKRAVHALESVRRELAQADERWLLRRLAV